MCAPYLLHTLSFPRGTFQRIGPMQLNALQSIKLNVCVRLTSIEGLSNCSNLRSIEFSLCDNLSDISPLKFCTKLRMIKAHFCKNILDISWLTFCRKMHHINLAYCGSDLDLDVLYILPNLKTYYVYECGLSREKENELMIYFNKMGIKRTNSYTM